MFCTNCGFTIQAASAACGRCGARVGSVAGAPQPGFFQSFVNVVQATSQVVQAAFEPSHREVLLSFMLDDLTSQGLSDWLRELRQDARGTTEEKKQRIRLHTPFLRLPPAEMLRVAMGELKDSLDLEPLCHRFGVPADLPKQTVLRRLHRFLAWREGVIPSWRRGEQPGVREVYQFVSWYPVYKTRSKEKEHYEDFETEMRDIFGDQLVHSQVHVAHGTGLKIDFHIGDPMRGGVGIEFKMPANNSDIQKAMGQLDQYQSRYGHGLVVVVFPDFIETKSLVPFTHDLARRNITHVIKRGFWEDAT